MKTLEHSGILLPIYEPVGLSITIKGKKVKMMPLQEEMAVYFIKKKHLDCMKDEVFIRNFLYDFARAFGLSNGVTMQEVDFRDVENFVEKQKKKKESMSKEERKADLEARKKIAGANKEKYGYATVDGKKVELANYRAEPAGIFMGRSNHPLRGRWKPAVKVEDITLNLSSEAPTPKGFEKAKREWAPESYWIAKWDNNRKYVWISESEPMRQEEEVEKYDKANELAKNINGVKMHILMTLADKKQAPLRRKVATCCYLIESLGIRVGDEKDEDEADTIGATTLRREHAVILEEPKNLVTFDFLGKDGVRFFKEVKMPPAVVENLAEFSKEKNDSGLLFDGVSSIKVNAFLKEAMEGLTAKVFRTYLATKVAKDCLDESRVSKKSHDYEKVDQAKRANLMAAIAMNHKRKQPKNWVESIEKKEKKLRELLAKATPSSLKAADKLAKEIDLACDLREYNLNTSLRSYLDPRVFVKWAKDKDLDAAKIYPANLQKKFSWALK
jgi:DNA topoisomerase-1